METSESGLTLLLKTIWCTRLRK